MWCFVIALEFQSISISLSLCLTLTLTLSLLLSLYSFCSGHNTDCDMEYFWDLHCLAVVCCFWYLQLCLFYFCLSGTTILAVLLFAIALFVCIVCHYCLSGTTILTLINYGLFVLVFALIVCIVSCFSRSG